MNKIIEKALSTKYNTADIPALLELVQQSKNTEVAVEMLLGIYQEPIINEQAHEKCETAYEQKRVKNFDKWSSRVTFIGWKNVAKEGEPPIHEERESYCSLRTWNTGNW